MPHIAVRPDLPGITGLMEAKPSTGMKLREFTEQLLRGPSPLSQGERELIAARVSELNDCTFCASSHGAAARYALRADGAVLDGVHRDADADAIGEKMRALLALAEQVTSSGKAVDPQDIARARDAGASDEDLHDTVLIAAAFCMFNRYVDGLDAYTPRDERAYLEMGRRLVTDGYLSMPGPSQR